ncbi:cytochrome p450 [Trifolium pratense]|uniref:Cytochrome p450 n=1 Tax=Trifolium pratense TaxID=57577 RepID=A0A2K3NYN2_TRIPR|nr:cytochrome p450 [Trifolium pratense]
MHVFFWCSRTIQCWQHAGLWENVNAGLASNNNVAENLFSVMHKLDKAQQELFNVMAWSIWKCRNNQVWNNITESSQTVYNRAMHLITSWQNAQQVHALAHLTQPVGIGMCIRNYKGQFVAARTEWIEPIMEVEVGEAMGLLKALIEHQDLAC